MLVIDAHLSRCVAQALTSYALLSIPSNPKYLSEKAEAEKEREMDQLVVRKPMVNLSDPKHKTEVISLSPESPVLTFCPLDMKCIRAGRNR